MARKLCAISGIAALAGTLFLLSGCGGQGESERMEGDLFKITLQTDWLAQPEHGGFYAALAKGYYEEAGLKVTIVPGGPNSAPVQKIAKGDADFSIGRSDDLIIANSRGIPVIMVAALMQHDPQGIMYHAESGIEGFEDLDGRVLMAGPGTPFVQIMKAKYDIDVNVKPLDYGVVEFLGDPEFTQQCFVTSEPYYVKKRGANPRVLMISDMGFDPYRVIYTNKSFAEEHPEIVEAFVAASLRGWASYISGDRDDAEQLLAQENPKYQDEEFRDYVFETLRERNLVEGYSERGEAIGVLKPGRVERNIAMLSEFNFLESDVSVEDVMTTEFLPEEKKTLALAQKE